MQAAFRSAATAKVEAQVQIYKFTEVLSGGGDGPLITVENATRKSYMVTVGKTRESHAKRQVPETRTCHWLQNKRLHA